MSGILTPDWLPCTSSQAKSIPDNGLMQSKRTHSLTLGGAIHLYVGLDTLSKETLFASSASSKMSLTNSRESSSRSSVSPGMLLQTQTKAMDQTRLALAPPTDFDGRV